jgi:ABC-type nitrate/sulfonate/bicarbonate transport system substrate-binding protein
MADATSLGSIDFSLCAYLRVRALISDSNSRPNSKPKSHRLPIVTLRVKRSVLLAGVAALLLCVPSYAQQSALPKIRVITLNRPLPVVIAQSHGVFAKYGIDVDIVVVPSSEVLRTGLAAGRADVAFTAVDNDVAMVKLANADVVILMGGESSLNELIVQPGIKSPAELRRQRVLVDAPNTAYAMQLKKVLLMHGLETGKDYEMKPVGSTAFRLNAMKEDKDNAAAVMNPPFTILAKHAGLVSLGSMTKLLGKDQDRAVFAMRAWATDNADLLERYLAGHIEGQRWLVAPEHKQEVVELVMKESNLAEPLAKEWYDVEILHGGYAKDARFDVAGFKKTLELRAEIEEGN